MSVSDNLERLTEAVDRLIIRLETLQVQRNKLARKVQELEYRIENNVDSVDPEGYNLLRIHSARLLRERQDLKERLTGVLEKLESELQR
jgi:chaperonin cofactor prefoldin